MKKLFENTLTGKRSDKIYEVVGEEPLTLDNAYVATLTGGTRTLFNEIVTVPYNEVIPSFYLELWEVSPQSRKTTLEKFVNDFIVHLRNHIEEIWIRNPDKLNVVLHSGGWDSRILSAIMRQVYEKNGGKVKFVCYGPECKVLSTIMEIEGWNKDQYTSLQWNDNYFGYNLNFQTAWRHLNGSSTFPMNPISWIINNLKMPTSDIEVWSAAYFNEVFLELRGKKLILGFYRKFYYWWSTNLFAALPCDFILPILNKHTLRHIIESDVALPPDHKLKEKIVKALSSELLKIPRASNPTNIRIPKKFHPQIEKDYMMSWYGKQNPNVKRDFRFAHSPWWSAWSSASLIEYVLSKGIKIK